MQGSPARARLVIVADNALTVKAIRNAFRATAEFELAGYANVRTTKPQTLLGVQPDVILLDDMGQSELSIELLRAIRVDDRRVPVIVLGMQLDTDRLQRIFAAGATAVISKATPPAALATLVRETLHGHIVHPPPTRTPATVAPACASVAAEPALTRRELEILQFVASGLTNGDIARRLWVTEQTVKFHLRNIFRKLDVANRTQASHFAHTSGLIDFAATSERRLTLAAS
jgi:DNA-binding NarL/FixJ family response regulator